MLCRCSWDCDIIWFRVYSCFTSPIGFLFVVAAEIFRRTFFTTGGSGGLLAFIWWRLSKHLPACPCWPPQGCWGGRLLGALHCTPLMGVLGWLSPGESGIAALGSASLQDPALSSLGRVRDWGLSGPWARVSRAWAHSQSVVLILKKQNA